MMNKIAYISFILLWSMIFVSCKPQDKKIQSCDQEVKETQEIIEKISPKECMVLINATNQGYSYNQPWNKKKPSYSHGFGTYIGDGLFLTNAGIVQDASFIRMVSHDEEEMVMAEVVAIDEEVNLALLKPVGETGEKLLNKLKPLKVIDDENSDLALGDEVEIWQFTGKGLDSTTSGTLESTNWGVPLTYGMPFVLYEIKSPVNAVTGGATMPVIKDGKLAGLSLMSETSEQLLVSLPIRTIRSFMERALDQNGYQGLPAAGLVTEELMDPVFKRYLKIDEKNGGVYISEVREHSSAYKAGIKKGDVLLNVNGHRIDGRGMVMDEKLGPVNCSALMRDWAKVGNVVKLTVSRDGEEKVFDVTLDRDSLEKALIAVTNDEGQPRYIVYGGLVFQPVSRPYVSDVYQNDPNKMRSEILDVFDREEELSKEGREEVILLTHILPTPATHGYEGYGFSMLDRIDGAIPKNMKHLSELLNAVANKEVIEIKINKPPYSFYISPKDAIKSNDYIKKAAFSKLENI